MILTLAKPIEDKNDGLYGDHVQSKTQKHTSSDTQHDRKECIHLVQYKVDVHLPRDNCILSDDQF